jgi:hypothetical protein
MDSGCPVHTYVTYKPCSSPARTDPTPQFQICCFQSTAASSSFPSLFAPALCVSAIRDPARGFPTISARRPSSPSIIFETPPVTLCWGALGSCYCYCCFLSPSHLFAHPINQLIDQSLDRSTCRRCRSSHLLSQTLSNAKTCDHNCKPRLLSTL